MRFSTKFQVMLMNMHRMLRLSDERERERGEGEKEQIVSVTSACVLWK